MTKKILLSILMVSVAVLAIAYGPGMYNKNRDQCKGQGFEHRKWWKNPKAVEKLGLTQDQINKLDSIHQGNQPNLDGIKADVKQKAQNLKDLFNAEPMNEKAIQSAADALISAKGEMQRNHIIMMLEMKKILTPEQSKQLNEFRNQMRLHHKENRFHRMHQDFDFSQAPPLQQPPNK